ncbi:unnamed protein product [Arctogadus glacialis]
MVSELKTKKDSSESLGGGSSSGFGHPDACWDSRGREDDEGAPSEGLPLVNHMGSGVKPRKCCCSGSGSGCEAVRSDLLFLHHHHHHHHPMASRLVSAACLRGSHLRRAVLSLSTKDSALLA